jgi:DNA modification methylase
VGCIDQLITENYAIYNGDACQVLPDIPDESVGLSIYSPPFGGLYHYSSAEEDLSNASDYETFFAHYDYIVEQVYRVTKPGRMTCVHCAEVPKRGDHGMTDFPGDIIRQHERLGFDFWARYAVWKEPLKVAILTRAKRLTHRQIVKDSSLCANAGADFLLVFRKPGENKEPIGHPVGLAKYCGAREVPPDLKVTDDPQTNKRAHWIWQQYASCFWDDVRIGRVLSYKAARESDEEKHVHPLQLDFIERCVILWSNPKDIVLSPFAGVGSEVYGALINGRRGIGIELKESYYRQSIRNLCDLTGEAERLDLGEEGETDPADIVETVNGEMS